MKSTFRTIALTLCVSLTAGLFTGPAAWAADAVAEWAPQDSLLFLGVPSWDDLTTAYKKTGSYRSLEDAALKEKMQPWKTLFENAEKLIAKEIGLENPKDLEIWPHGGVAAFLRADMPTGENDDEAYLCLVADMGADADRLRELAAKVVQHCVTKGAERSTEEFAGTEIVTIKFKPEDEKADGAESNEDADAEDESGGTVEALLDGVEIDEMQRAVVTMVLGSLEAPESFAFAFAGTRLVLATDTATVKDTLARLRRGAEGTLAGVRDVQAFGRRGGQDANILAVVNIPALIEGLSRNDEDAKTTLSGLSMDAFGALVMGVQVAPAEGVESRIRGFLRIDSRPHGLGRILMMENVDTAPPSGVSADTAIYASINLNPQLILDEVLAIAEQMNPDGAEQMRSSLTLPQEDGSVVDVKKDVVAHLAGPLTVGLNLAKPFDSENINLIVRLGHKSRDAMTKLAALLPAGMFIPTEILGHTVYGTPMMPGMAMGFTDSAVIPFATRKALEGYIRSEGQSGRGLAQTPAFQKVARHVPAQSCAMLYVDSLLCADAQIALADKGKETENADEQPAAPTLSDRIREGLMQSAEANVDLLKALRKYQSRLIMTMSTESDGLAFDGVGVLVGESEGE